MKLALGTVQFGLDYGVANSNGQVHLNEVARVLNYARSRNIRLLDTAPAYGNSEQVLGEVNAHDFKIITKIRQFNQVSIVKKDVDLLISDFDQSLQLLNRKSIYGLLIHNAEDFLKEGFDKVYKQLQLFKAQGLITNIGVSVYTGEQLQKIIDRFDIDLVQLPFNILDKRLIDSGILNKIHNQGIEVPARSVFLQGLLLMTEQSRPRKFNRWKDLWKLWHEWLSDNKLTALEATIRYAISTPEISRVLVGVNSRRQLQDIIKAADGDIPPIPKELFIHDTDLLNPENWYKL